MKRRHSIEDWRRAVFAAPSSHLSDGARVVLLYLADHMRDSDLKVSVSRKTMARDLNRSERRIAEKLSEATDLTRSPRYLDRVVRGQKHVQAVYAAVIPDDVSAGRTGVPLSTSQGDGNQHPENPEIRHPENPALSVESGSQRDPRGSRLTRAEPSRALENRNDGSEDESCRWHRFEVCPSDCANSDRRETA